jgi:hypothetical protein
VVIGELALGYVAIGVVIAIAVAIAKRPPVLDLAIVAFVWPLYAPLVLVLRPPAADRREAEMLAAFARARTTALAPLVPDEATARRLGKVLRAANARLVELDATLARPELDRTAVADRALALAAHGSPAAPTAQLHARTLDQLDELRGRYRRDLDDIAELTTQLAAHADLLALDPRVGRDTATTDTACELIAEIVARVDRLDQEYDPGPGCLL